MITFKSRAEFLAFLEGRPETTRHVRARQRFTEADRARIMAELRAEEAGQAENPKPRPYKISAGRPSRTPRQALAALLGVDPANKPGLRRW